MTTVQELLDLEERFWTQGRAFYREHVDGECLIAFPQMAQVMSNEDVAATVKDGQRWHDVEIVSKGFVEPSSSLTIITYEASATSHDGKSYRALVSSGYVKRKDGWKMAFHQQTPLATAA